MRSRLKLHCKALLTAAQFAAMLLLLTFFFYDGPIRAPRLMASALATSDAETLVDAAEPVASASVSPKSIFTDGRQVAWKKVLLDQSTVSLNLLKNPLRLAETTRKSGSEAFEYAAHLYRQMAHEVRDQELAAHLGKLSVESETMGASIREASGLRFDGAPSEDMTHLQVRAAILFHLKNLNKGAWVTARYNQQGGLLTQEQGQSTNGEALSQYFNHVKQVLQLPAATQYPETMKLLSQESDLLGQVAHSMTLRWESTLYCKTQCEDMATFMRIYTRQSLPDATLVSVVI